MELIEIAYNRKQYLTSTVADISKINLSREMVRKRTRTRSARRKTYDSDENDSDTELSLDSEPSSPAPKRYGLRQRKRPLFCEDFDYDEDEELASARPRSDDEDYNIELDLQEVKDKTVGLANENVFINTIEAEEEAALDDGLIDFEDVIRADVVVNKQRVDYDNVISKTEIEIEPLEEKNGKKYKQQVPIREKGRRGRKPKSKIPPETNLEDSLVTVSRVEDFSDDANNSQDDDTNLEVQIDPASLVQSDSDEDDPITTNGVSSEEGSKKSIDHETEIPKENGTLKVKNETSRINQIEKYIPPELDDKDKEVMLSNEYLLGNSFDISADEFLEKQAQVKDQVEEEEEEIIPLINFDDDDDDSSNDVVIIEAKPDVIVLDDD